MKIERIKSPRVIFLLAHVPQMAIGVVIVLLFSRLVSTIEFGVFAKAFAFVNIASALLYGWMQMAFMRKAAGSSESAPLDISTIGISLLSPLLPVCVAVSLLSFAGFLEAPAPVGLAAIAYASSNALSQYARGLNSPRLYAVIGLVRFLGILVLGFIFARHLPTASSLILAVAIGSLLSIPPALVFASRKTRCLCVKAGESIRKETIKSLFAYGAPASVSMLAVMIMIHGDRFLASNWLSPDLLGRYSAQVDIARQIVYPVIAALATSLVPTALSRHRRQGESDALQFIALESQSLLRLTLPLVLIVAFFPGLVMDLLLPDSYSVLVESAAGLSGLAAWLMACRLVMFDPVFHLLTKPGLIAISALAGLLTWLVVIAPMTSMLGANGLAGAGLFSSGVSLLVAFVLGFRLRVQHRFLDRSSVLLVFSGAGVFLVFKVFADYGYLENSFAAISAAGLTVCVALLLAKRRSCNG